MSQKETLLNLFQRKSIWTNHELRDLQPPMYQYPVRIKEINDDLRSQGMEIVGYFHETDKKTYFYELKKISLQGDLFIQNRTSL